MIINRRSLLVLAVLAGLSPLHVQAAEPGRPEALVTSFVDQALVDIGDHTLADRDREAKLATLLEKYCDMPRISRFVAGAYWNGANAEDRTQFSDLFEQWLAHHVILFDKYGPKGVKVTGARADGDTITMVSTDVLYKNGDTPDKVDWVVRRDGNDFKVVDVIISGVSLASTERQEIGSAIYNSGGSLVAANAVLKSKLANDN